ncbi:sialate O-acetylesterase [Parabacteroides sp. OttesenSCG-928-G06]|nr:sialate O-acetylesterase [Parabacteroides sp. OttesenSCG-928-K15]MDL2282758.1 sialate O-acetylesterase [Parabacteroides sp. OttesenSCG-928-G06]
MLRKKLIITLLACFVFHLSAKVKLPDLISNHMVLQQNTEVRLWGECEPGIQLTVEPSWSEISYKTRSDIKGFWEIRINTPQASYEKYSIKISDGEPVLLEDVLIGEVWFCSGQSNMQMILSGYGGSPIEGAQETIADAGNHPYIRVATIERKAALTPQTYAGGSWKTSDTENAPGFSATAYHFALTLEKTLQMPIGIIASAWGGSRVEGWLPEEILRTFPDEDLSEAGKNKDWRQMYEPMIMYNGLLYPSSKYTIKGFVWYQGCSNVGHADVYAERLAIMVDHWRSLWGQKEAPFYFAEIAPYAYDQKKDSINGALLREAQYKAQKLIPQSWMITTNDLVFPYEVYQIHPAKKKEVGQRLGWQALQKTYGHKGILADSPAYKSMEIVDKKIRVFIDNAHDGLSPWMNIEGFEIAGEDRTFHPATAVIEGNTILVSAENVTAPVAVRYCFRNFQVGNVKGNRGLPLIPFRTDNWE